MASKLENLQSALNSSSGRSAASDAAAPTRVSSSRHASSSAKTLNGSREGKENIAAWLPTGYKKSIRLVQAQRPGDPSLQELMAEAFNDLFIKYNVPTVSE